MLLLGGATSGQPEHWTAMFVWVAEKLAPDPAWGKSGANRPKCDNLGRETVAKRACASCPSSSSNTATRSSRTQRRRHVAKRRLVLRLRHEPRLVLPPGEKTSLH